jgi:GH15 family glucan-1,4-alpha-glucosidase
MGFGTKSTGVQVGQDSYQTGGAGTSAYDDAADGELSGVTVAAGQSDAALSDDLDLKDSRTAALDIFIAAGPDAGSATTTIDAARQAGFAKLRSAKKEWWKGWLRGAKLPKGAPSSVRTLAKRALVSIRQASDPGGLVVASIATQPPYGLDWIRNGAYVNHALELAGHPEIVESHNEQYSDLQATTTSQPPGGGTTPSGNWAQDYYADGVVGGPLPYAVDETGLGIFTLWDHYAVTHDRAYLLGVYEAIQRAAQYLTDVCRDPSTALQCAAPEGDDASSVQTIRGAAAVWLGLDSASKAASAKARIENQGADIAKSNAQRWADRRDELGAAMKAQFFDAGCSCYPAPDGIGGEILWPVQLFGYGSGPARAQAGANFKEVARALAGRASEGGSESQTLLGNAYVWRSGAKLRKLRRALRWVARTPTTDDTNVLGEAWMKFPDDHGPITTMSGQPYVPTMAMFYLASLRAWGTTAWTSR